MKDPLKNSQKRSIKRMRAKSQVKVVLILPFLITVFKRVLMLEASITVAKIVLLEVLIHKEEEGKKLIAQEKMKLEIDLQKIF